MTDDELLRGLELSSLGADQFHHAEHLRAAFLYLGRYPVLQAVEKLSSALQRLAAAHGKAHRYHQTITWAFMFLIHERMVRSTQSQNWSEFSRENRDLLNWNDNILKRYYEEETLKSDLARKVFLLPERFTAKLSSCASLHDDRERESFNRQQR